MKKNSKLKDTVCPNCDKSLNAATAVNNHAQPEPGDVSVCAYCSHLLVYKEDLTVRQMDMRTEFMDLEEEVRLDLLTAQHHIIGRLNAEVDPWLQTQ